MLQKKEKTSRVIQPFIDYYQDYYDEMVTAMEILQLSFADMEEDLARMLGRNPVEHIKSRIKTPESMRNKISRIKNKTGQEVSPRDLFDGCGIRIITTFIDDIYTIRDWIVARPDIMLMVEKDYVRHPKASGYRSHHLQIRVRIEVGVWVNAEIQIRTIVMDSWAQLEHQLYYKKHLLNVDRMAYELKRCADEMASTDLNLMTIRNRIGKNREGDLNENSDR